jgi:hypothetical protein
MNQEEINEIFAEIVKDLYVNEHELREQAHYGLGKQNEENT